MNDRPWLSKGEGKLLLAIAVACALAWWYSSSKREAEVSAEWQGHESMCKEAKLTRQQCVEFWYADQAARHGG